MNKRILISTVFISNIIFASVLPSQINQINLNKNRLGSFSTVVSQYLYKKGLDKEVAQKKVSNFLMGEDFENELMLQNILSNLDMLQYDNVVEYIASSALYSKKIDLSSYDTIIGMLQTVNSNLDKLTLQKIEKVSLENKKIRQLHAV